jgi:hypothetical protein
LRGRAGSITRSTRRPCFCASGGQPIHVHASDYLSAETRKFVLTGGNRRILSSRPRMSWRGGAGTKGNAPSLLTADGAEAGRRTAESIRKSAFSAVDGLKRIVAGCVHIQGW